MNLKGVRVLLVEDEPDSREVLAFILEYCGAEVATAASVPEAMEIFDRAQPSVLVSDISRPGEDGYGLIRRVRNRTPAAGGTGPAVAVTAFRYEHNRDRCLSAGFQEYLSKPVDPDVLCNTVSNVAGLRAASPPE